MAFASITNHGEYISDHYLATLLRGDLEDLRQRWKATDQAPPSSARGIKALGPRFFTHRNRITERLAATNPPDEPTGTTTAGTRADRNAPPPDPRLADAVRALNDTILSALAFHGPGALDDSPRTPGTDTNAPDTNAGRATTESWLRRAKLDVVHLDQRRQVPVALAVRGITGLELVALDATWADTCEGIVDADGGSLLLDPIQLDAGTTVDHAGKAVEFLLGCEDPPRYVLLLTGNVVLLADRSAWPRQYLAVDLTQALHTRDDKPGGELETIAALFGAESLLSHEGQHALASLVDNGHKHAVSVSKELREALRRSVELIAQEILDRVREQGATDDDLDALGDDLARRLTEQSLRYLYRILFLLYAEARPELGILPGRDEAYQRGYGLGRLAETVSHDLPEEAEHGLYFHQSLDLLFQLVDSGHHPRTADDEVVLDADGNRVAVERGGIRFEALKSDLFHPARTGLIGAHVVVGRRTVDTRLRNKCLWRVLNMLTLTPEPVSRTAGRGRFGGRGRAQRGFISYAQLGINQLGAVYEGLMSYTGFFAPEDVYEVAKTVKGGGKTADGDDKEKADPSKGTWIVPVARAGDYDDRYFVLRPDPTTGEPKRVIHRKGSFVYRLSGRERQRSASYYTPEVLTRCTVKHALAELLTDAMTARDILDLTVCEPALGSGAFLNEAINQLADAYLDRAQRERGEKLLPDKLEIERQKVKAYLALHNCYGVDLNATAVELAEVSIWLNVMHEKLEAPWFGLHLRPGNSLIGARRAGYSAALLRGGKWRTTPPTDHPMACDANGQVIDRLADDEIHHFLLPAQGWAAVVDAKQAAELAPVERAALMEWRKKIRVLPNDKRTKDRLLALAQRVERLWELTRKRIAISEREIRRTIDVWGVDPDRPLPHPASGAVTRDEIVTALYDDQESPYNRLKIVMDAWCALWFWPVGQGDDIAPPTLDEWLSFCESVLGTQPAKAKPRKGAAAGHEDLLGLFDANNDFTQLADEDSLDRSVARCQPISQIAIDDRFAWWSVLTDITTREGFFHWELEFAQIFAQGGFALQVGNPPWVRPVWDDHLTLAEFEPWFALQDKIPEPKFKARRAEVLADPSTTGTYLADLNSWSGLNEHLGSPTEHPLLAGVQTNLYTNFMERVWRSLGHRGAAGLIHPESHFTDPVAGGLRTATYARLRRHFHFRNELQLFEEIMHTREYGIHIYGRPKSIDFINMSWLFTPSTIDDSLDHRWDGERPGLQFFRPGAGWEWDTRPHETRAVRVDQEVLSEWARLVDVVGTRAPEARLVRPITTKDNEILCALTESGTRLGEWDFWWTSGLHEKGSKTKGLIEWRPDCPEETRDIILQGVMFTVANPFATQFTRDAKKNTDTETLDPAGLDARYVPRTAYQRLCSNAAFDSALGVNKGQIHGAQEVRLAWRRMIDPTTQRSLHAIVIPPGPTHVHTVHTMALSTRRRTAALAGLWAGIPLDYLCKISGKRDMQIELVRQFPAPLGHVLATPLVLRTLRLNCLTRDYAPLWKELFDEAWLADRWAVAELGRTPLGGVGAEWTMGTPLRTDYDRRLALVEIDALVAIMLGLTAEQLCAMYRSQFAVLRKYEWEMFFAPDGHRIGAETHNRGVRQTDAETEIVKAWKKARLTGAPDPVIPDGWVKPDREKEMTRAYEEFQRRLANGEYPEVPTVPAQGADPAQPADNSVAVDGDPDSVVRS